MKRSRLQERKREEIEMKGDAHILTLDFLADNLMTRCCEECRTTSLIDRILHEGASSGGQNRADDAICILGLFLLIRAHGSGVRSVGPDLLSSLEPKFALLHAADQGSDKQHLSELGAIIEVRWTDVLVDLVQGSELGATGRHSMKIRRLHNQSGVGCLLKGRKEGQTQMHLGEMVDLKMGVLLRNWHQRRLSFSTPSESSSFQRTYAIFGLVVHANTKASIADELFQVECTVSHVPKTTRTSSSHRAFSYAVQLLQILLEFLGHLIGLMEVLKVALHPFDFFSITPVLKRVNGLLSMFLLHAQQDDLGSVVLKQMSYNTEANTG